MSRLLPRALIVVALVLLVGASTAAAHLPQPHHPLSRMTPAGRVHYWTAVEAHALYVSRHGRGAPARAHAQLARFAAGRLHAARAELTPPAPPHEAAWECIHRYEGAWTDPGAPYFGGLQMDLQFQATYGPGLLRRKGTADHWTPLEQMWVAERAYASGRGFWPWPNTARYCGLL